MPKPILLLGAGVLVVAILGGAFWYVDQQRKEIQQDIEKFKEEIGKDVGKGSLAERALNICQDSIDEKLSLCQKYENWELDILVGYTNTDTKEGKAFERKIYGPNNKCSGATAGEKEPLKVKGEFIDSQEGGISNYEAACSVTCFSWECPEEKETKVSSESPLGFWEFLDIDRGWTKISDLPIDSPVHLIVASNGTPDIRTLLPIRVELLVGEELVWQKNISGDPKAVCRGTTGCSIDGPTIQSQWKGKSIKLQAYSKENKLLAVCDRTTMTQDDIDNGRLICAAL